MIDGIFTTRYNTVMDCTFEPEKVAIILIFNLTTATTKTKNY